jgi:hypothetical protein
VKERIEKIKQHVKEHKEAYIVGAIGAGVAAGTWLVMRDTDSQSIRDAIGVPARGAIGVPGERIVNQNIISGKNNVLNSVSYISANRQGPPSWVVRCKETGEIFTSQKSAAIEMGLSPSHLSNHLNGIREHVDGNHFERICLAA